MEGVPDPEIGPDMDIQYSGLHLLSMIGVVEI
jgi:hypothetical protein